MKFEFVKIDVKNKIITIYENSTKHELKNLGIYTSAEAGQNTLPDIVDINNVNSYFINL